MRTVFPWVLLALLCHQAVVRSHVVGTLSSNGDLARLKSLLERFEESLAGAAQEEYSDYEGPNQETERGQAGRGWSPEQEGNKEAFASSERAAAPPPPAEGLSRTASQRSRLQDLLMGARKRASGCFGARMDRIGNASGLGCNSGRG
ncbi:natriuretic peptides A [Mugil cephalus]|uniref:natriuretic peptides A n=1 Tax=Mugil cephalus TaxID=48193 RepID=UPI001FB57143|nr:natriuretic peptides A [Mugil cephalus]